MLIISTPWGSKVYNHNGDGTLALTLRFALLILTSISHNYGNLNNVSKVIILTDLR